MNEKAPMAMAGLRELVRLVLGEAKLEAGETRIPISKATALAEALIQALGLTYVDPSIIDSQMEWSPGCGYPVGSIRRGKADIGDIDIIVTSPIRIQQLKGLKGISGLYGGTKQVNFAYAKGGISRKVNLFICTDPNVFGAFLMHSTGPQFYNVRLRKVAQARGWKLSQNGLIDENGQLIAGETEAEIQSALGVKNREPDER